MPLTHLALERVLHQVSCIDLVTTQAFRETHERKFSICPHCFQGHWLLSFESVLLVGHPAGAVAWASTHSQAHSTISDAFLEEYSQQIAKVIFMGGWSHESREDQEFQEQHRMLGVFD